MRQQQPRASQNWIFDNFLKLPTNEDALHPGILGLRLERGFEYRDLEGVFHAATARRRGSRIWFAHSAMAASVFILSKG
jgi:hypothetical protein